LAKRVDKRKYKDRREYFIKAVYARRKKIRQMSVDIKAASVKYVAIVVVLMRLNFIIAIAQKRILVYLAKDIPGLGSELQKNLISVQCFVPIAIENSMPKLAALAGNCRMKSE